MKSAGQKGGRQKRARTQTPSATVTIPLQKQNVTTSNARQDVMASGSSLLATYQKPPTNIQFFTSSVSVPCVFPSPQQQMTCPPSSLQSSWLQASQQQHNWFTSPQQQNAGGLAFMHRPTITQVHSCCSWSSPAFIPIAIRHIPQVPQVRHRGATAIPFLSRN